MESGGRAGPSGSAGPTEGHVSSGDEDQARERKRGKLLHEVNMNWVCLMCPCAVSAEFFEVFLL